MSFLLPRRGAGMTGYLEQEFSKSLQDGPLSVVAGVKI